MSGKYGVVPSGPELHAQIQRRKLGAYSFEIFPELWSELDCRNYYMGRAWSEVHFMPSNRQLVPQASGIYMFVARSGYSASITDHSHIFYIGKATDLNSRYYSYLREQRFLLPHNRQKVGELLSDFDGWLFFRYTLVPTTDLDMAEDFLKDNITPPGNTQVAIIGRLSTTTPA